MPPHPELALLRARLRRRARARLEAQAAFEQAIRDASPGLSIRAIAEAVDLHPSRVHQIIQAGSR